MRNPSLDAVYIAAQLCGGRVAAMARFLRTSIRVLRPMVVRLIQERKWPGLR